ncbi:MAG TPA: molybdenum cofactor guanylyltransferase [Ignavibacteria bacterium]|nr:molybdenum cofactor guanylyltransferase [Ignavibacteria bacterium]
MYTYVTGVILVGGKSIRMGENKALMKLGSKTVIERMVDIVRPLFSNIILISNTPEEYKFLQLPVFEDVYKYRGPLAGIHSALLHSKTEKNFIISCDIPLMSGEMINYLITYKTGKPVTICEAAGYTQPLAGVYNKSILSKAEKFLIDHEIENSDKPENEKKKCRMHSFLDTIEVEMLHPENLDFYSDDLFFNMNSPEDYEKILNTNWD